MMVKRWNRKPEPLVLHRFSSSKNALGPKQQGFKIQMVLKDWHHVLERKAI